MMLLEAIRSEHVEQVVLEETPNKREEGGKLDFKTDDAKCSPVLQF